MASITAEAWRSLPERSAAFADLSAHAIDAVPGVYLAVDHDGARHLLLPVTESAAPVRDERSRGIHALTRPLSVAGQPERLFVDVVCASTPGQEVFNLVATAIVDQLGDGAEVVQTVTSTLSRWRHFWGGAPQGGLTDEQVRGLFGELWFLAVWLLPHGSAHVHHWLGPTGARHDFQWRALAIEAKATESVRGHVHRINGIDQLETPAGGELFMFSLRARGEVTADNSIVALIDRIGAELAAVPDRLDLFETRLAQAGYSPLERERYSEMRYRVINERLYRVADGFPRLSSASFVSGVPAGIERIEYEIDLDACPGLLVASTPGELVVPPLDEVASA